MKFDLTFLHDTTKETSTSTKKMDDTSAMKRTSLFDLTLPTLRQSIGSPSSHSSSGLPPPPEEHLGASAGSTRSASIPLPESHIDRTHSELQLCLDEAAAEQREILMFYRVVNGIRERQQKLAADLPMSHLPTVPITRRELSSPSLARDRSQSFPYIVPREEEEDQPWAPSREQEQRHCSLPVAMDGWSIGGYDEAPQGNSVGLFSTTHESPSHPQDDEMEDQGIFDMEL